MLFNSYAFLLGYLPVVLLVFFGLSKIRLIQAAKVWLLISSLFFYGYWDVRFLPLLMGSILFNFFCGAIIVANKGTLKIFVLFFGIFLDIALLFYFKYYNFFISNFQPNESSITHIILPLGISFFTFTQIAYLVDLYQSKTEPSNFLSYALFVTIFPHLIAGPILHHKEMIKQFNNLRMYIISWPNISQGMMIFIVGLFKKVIIADTLAEFVKPIFDSTTDPVPFIQAWFGALSYTLQLYFDFSGYSSMAVGLGLLFGLHLPINFNSPYKADSIIDFWRRWHITLSNFLKDYLYIPLGGSRNGKMAKIRNLFITMALGGIWHGAGWTYILWGVAHGSFLIINHLWRDLKISMPNLLAKFLTFLAIIIAWVIFRSPTVDQSFNILKGMAGFNGIVLPESYFNSLGFLGTFGFKFINISQSNFKFIDLIMVGALTVILVFFPSSNYFIQRLKRWPTFCAIFYAVLFLLCFLNLNQVTDFLYYQF
ncbi:MAG: MBOAT family protein [Parachlamydiaceae bacterium]|nr:MBOAT family protein [Parachlamydiaceae bacterium]